MPFILIATFTMLNLFIAIIVDTMQSMHEKSHEAEQHAIEDVVHQEHAVVDQELRALRDEIRQLREALGEPPK